MNIDTGARLRENWKAKGSPPCDHPEVAIERGDRRRTTGAYVCTTCGSIVTDIQGRRRRAVAGSTCRPC
jgi:DNA-directed RNA polymerase subunit RPC12/RpoP